MVDKSCGVWHNQEIKAVLEARGFRPNFSVILPEVLT